MDRAGSDRARVVAALADAIAHVEADTGMPDPTGPGQRQSIGRGADGAAVAAAKEACLRLLAVRPRSRAELATALRRKGIAEGAAEQALERLAEVNLIDDAAFAQLLVASKHRSRGLGRAALRTELRDKGVSDDLAEHALAAIDDDAEYRRACDLVAKKLDAAVFAGLPAARRRLMSMLARRGYSSSMVIRVVNDALHGYLPPVQDEEP